MLDFLSIAARDTKRGWEIYPKFKMIKSEDLMIRGGDFYAIWVEDRGLWSTDEQDALQLIDRELSQYAKEHKGTYRQTQKRGHCGAHDVYMRISRRNAGAV